MSEYIMNRESLKRHCEAMCKKFKDVPTSGTYGEHRLVLDLLEQTEWIPVSERLPEDFDTYLITLEDGVVCQCDFNPDFWDEDNNRMGAFTYNHQYFDPATLGMIDEEEEAVNAIAWMPFEPYKAEREE